MFGLQRSLSLGKVCVALHSCTVRVVRQVPASNLSKFAASRRVLALKSTPCNANRHWLRPFSRFLGGGLLLAGVVEVIGLAPSTPMASPEQRQKLREKMSADVGRGFDKIHQGLFQEAEGLLHSALGVARELAVEGDEAFILRNLGCVYFNQKKYRQAEETFKVVLLGDLLSGRVDSAEYSDTFIHISTMLAMAYGFQGDVNNAILALDSCLEIIHEKLKNATDENKEELVDVMLKVINQGSASILENETENGVAYVVRLMENGLAKAKELKQTGSLTYQIMACNLHILSASQNRVEEAVPVTLAPFSGHQNICMSYCYLSLANIYADNADFTNAVATAQKALEAAKHRNDTTVVEKIKIIIDLIHQMQER